MSVPNHFAVVQAVYDAGNYDLENHDDWARFVDDAVAGLHDHDENWGHVIKKPGQQNIHGHGEDSALYKLANNKAQACDFIQGAGGPAPRLRWGPDPEPYYTHADWLDPVDHDGGEQPPEPEPPAEATYPTYEELGGDAGGKKISVAMEQDYIRAGRPGLDGGCGAWMQRTAYDFLVGNVATVEESIEKHRASWCAELGIPVTNSEARA